jgi:hypothetical protein
MELDDLGETTASRSLPGDKFKVQSGTSSIDIVLLADFDFASFPAPSAFGAAFLVAPHFTFHVAATRWVPP